MPLVSIIIPTLNEEQHLGRLLAQLPGSCAGQSYEVVVVDAASQDRTVAIAHQHDARVVETSAGDRGHQLRVGVRHSHGDYLWLLHADVCLVNRSRLVGRLVQAVDADGAVAACLHLDYDSPGFFYRFLAASSNWRARHLGLVFGDQGLFLSRKMYDRVGGFPDVPLMEDWILSRKLARCGHFIQLPDRLLASNRKYAHHPWRVHAKLMWIKLLFICGASPQKLVALYYGKDRQH